MNNILMLRNGLYKVVLDMHVLLQSQLFKVSQTTLAQTPAGKLTSLLVDRAAGILQ
jgi:hypothetical protein